MSRIGKQPINIPANVDVKMADGFIIVKGPKGELRQALHSDVMINREGDIITVTVKEPEDKKQRSLWGLYRRLISNMVIGTTEGFSKQLEINGVGYKAVLAGKNLNLALGFSHPVEFPIPQGIEIKVEKNVVTISGFDKELVGQTAAEIRSLKKPEPYKGKGIKYSDETIIRKEGKSAAKGA
ncbi:MAG: 50S ribosomal protein L6 [Candidatus Buchananbacteria bacterium]